MQFHLSNYIAINVRNYEKAIAFYRDTLGWELLKQTPTESKFKKANNYFFIADDEAKAYTSFFEYEVDNIAKAKSQLLEQGCTMLTSYSPKSIMFSDPYGMNFHVYEKGAELPDL